MAYQVLIIIDGAPDDAQLISHFAVYRWFGTITSPYAREQGTATTIGLQAQSRRASPRAQEATRGTGGVGRPL